jgi:hypothetical protein
VCALFIAIPIHGWASQVFGRHPDGDAIIFRPGGHALLSWLGDDTAALPIVVRTTLAALGVSWAFGQLVSGSLIASIAIERGGRAPSLGTALGCGGRAWVPMMGMELLTKAIQGLLLGAGLLLSSTLDRTFQDSLGDASAFTVHLVVLTLFVAAICTVGVIADLGRVSIARNVALDLGTPTAARRVRDAVFTSARVARHTLGRAWPAWAWRAALGLGLLYVGARAGDHAGGRGGLSLGVLFGIQQLMLLGRVSLRASWLAEALRFALR